VCNAEAVPRSTTRIGNKIDSALNRLDDYLWAWGLRKWRRPELVEREQTGPPASLNRDTDAFSAPEALAAFRRARHIEDRLYNYVLYPGKRDVLCIHFSAFFDAGAARRRWRGADLNGFFHRLRMFWPLSDYHFLFVSDTFGAEDNGCYYKGLDQNFFVERATHRIIDEVQQELELDPSQIVTAGSSMGGTAALRFALTRNLAGAVAVCPHIDLDISALRQNRLPHVAAVLGSDAVEDPRFAPITREIRDLAGSVSDLPRLAIQSMEDDDGVHFEQVLPLIDLWRSRGGEVQPEFHATGGHTSGYATPEYFTRSLDWCLAPKPGQEGFLATTKSLPPQLGRS
jgi:pimeloyl-ACP methyl ester carboxylesterase